MTWLSYWGMAAIIVDHPTLMLGIKVLGTVYLLWLTYQMAISDFSAMVTEALKLEASENADAKIKKKFGELLLTFWQAALFQWLNPKTWAMTVDGHATKYCTNSHCKYWRKIRRVSILVINYFMYVRKLAIYCDMGGWWPMVTTFI